LLYRTIQNAAVSEHKEKASRFLAHAYEVNTPSEIKDIIYTLSKLHPKAVHICYAYRLGIDKNNFRVHDDGEPSNTAGKPILQAIDSYDVTNILIAVVRYYGGTKLGVSGLIKAYKTSAREALEKAGQLEKEMMEEVHCSLTLDQYNEAMRWLKQQKISLHQQHFNGNQYELTICIPASKLISFQEIIKRN
jgi:uncharacterized YigZ family protein